MPDPLARLQDATYTAIGFAVLSYQRARVRHRQLARDLEAVAGQLRRCATSTGGAK